MNPQIPPPGTPEEISPGWLSAVLRTAGVTRSATVTAVETTEIGLGRGYVCRNVRLVPAYDDPEPGVPASFVLKMPGFVVYPEEEMMRWMARLCSTEAYWYRDLGPECAVRVPRCYWHAVSDDGTKTWLLFEDLADMRMVDQVVGCSLAETELAVTDLARMHARWWEQPRVRGLPWIQDAATEGDWWQRRCLENFEAAWRIGIAYEMVPDDTRAIVQPMSPRIAGAMGQIFRDGAASGSTLVHGDYRAENFLFGDGNGAGDGLAVLDWQLVHWGSGLRDLGYFLAQSIPTELRERHERDLVRRYYEALREGGVTGYSREACERDYRRGLIFALGFVTASGNALEAMLAAGPGDVDEAGRQMWQMFADSLLSLGAVMTNRAIAAVLTNGAERLLPPA